MPRIETLAWFLANSQDLPCQRVDFNEATRKSPKATHPYHVNSSVKMNFSQVTAFTQFLSIKSVTLYYLP